LNRAPTSEVFKNVYGADHARRTVTMLWYTIMESLIAAVLIVAVPA
jgi:hypothetical protein